MNKRKKRDTTELHFILNHIRYELDMLTIVANALKSGIAGKSPLNNSLIESFAIHVRNLIDFIWPNNPSNDNVISDDFFNDKNIWSNVKPQITGNLNKARLRAHKEIAHISYDRLKVSPENKPWDFITITKEISYAMNLFFNNIPK
jgi:hypothetical protein